MVVNTNSPTVCIFGGTGFVGQSLAGLLIKAGYTVRIPTRRPSQHRGLLVLPGVELMEADVHDENTLSELLDGAHTAINLIGILNETGHDGSGFQKHHVALVEKILAACQEQGVTRLLHMSALKASAEHGPSHYLRTKGAAEKLIKTMAGGEFHYTIFQPSVIFGPRDSFITRFAHLVRLLPLFPLAKPDSRFAPVFVEDVAQAIANAIEMEAAYDQTFQLCGPNTYSLYELVTLITRTMGIRRIVVGLPDSLSRMQAWVMEYVPGKPFSRDNYQSLSVASTCTENGLAALGITAKSMTAVLPQILSGQGSTALLSRLRQSAGR